MGRTACTEPQCLYKGALYFYFNKLISVMEKWCVFYKVETKLLKYYLDKLQDSKNQPRFEAFTVGGEKDKSIFR